MAMDWLTDRIEKIQKYFETDTSQQPQTSSLAEKLSGTASRLSEPSAADPHVMLLLPDALSRSVGEMAESLKTKDTEIILGLLKDYFTNCNTVVEPMGTPGISSSAKAFVEEIAAKASELLGVIIVQSAEVDSDRIVLSFGLAPKTGNIVKAVIGVANTASMAGQEAFELIQQTIKQHRLRRIVIPGPSIQQEIPETPLKHIPMPAMARAFDAGVTALKGECKYNWRQEGVREIRADGKNYVLAYRIDAPLPKSKTQIALIWAFTKPEWSSQPQMPNPNKAGGPSGLCMVELDSKTQKAKFIHCFCGKIRKLGCHRWDLALLDAVLRVTEDLCRTAEMKYLSGYGASFYTKEDYTALIRAVLATKGYDTGEHTFTKPLNQTEKQLPLQEESD